MKFNKLIKLSKFLKDKNFLSESFVISNLIKEAITNFQCNSHSLGWIGPDSKFYLLTSDVMGGPMRHESWIEENLGVDYFDWKNSDESFGWIKVSNSTEYFSLGREFNSSDRIEIAKIFLHCMYGRSNLSYVQHKLKDDLVANFRFAIKNPEDERYSYSKISFFDFFEKIARESELGQELREIFYKMIDIDTSEDKPLRDYLSEDQLNSFIHLMPEEHVVRGEDDLLLDEVEFFKKKEIIPPHIFDRLANDVAERMDANSFFHNSQYIPQNIIDNNAEKKASELKASNLLSFYYDYEQPKIKKEIFEKLIVEKASELSDWWIEEYKEYMSEDLYSKIIEGRLY